VRASRDVEDHSPKPHRIIVAYGGLIAKAADPIDIQIFGQRPPRTLSFVRWLCKPSIEIGFERAIHKGGGVLRRGNAGEPELLN
jgi:hypothetical protein